MLTNSAANSLGILRGYIEKDYYIYLGLRAILAACPSMVFKGGTALSKCHRVIKRFSEDIDLGRNEQTLTQGQMRKLKYGIVDALATCDLEISNLADTRSRRGFNRYEVPYNTFLDDNPVDQFIYLETSIFDASVPYAPMQVGSFLYDYLTMPNNTFVLIELESAGAPTKKAITATDLASSAATHTAILERFDLAPFTANVMSLERTFIDKIFAICDYYLRDITTRNSRHLYDLYMIAPAIELNDQLAELARTVRTIRQTQELSVSAPNSVNIAKVLRAIHKKRFYEPDYHRNTEPMLFEQVPYHTVATILPTITNWIATVFA
jgi:hypothetical protein